MNLDQHKIMMTQYQLEKLEKQFILSEKDMLDMLRRKAIDTKISANLAKDSYLDYERRLRSSSHD